MEEKVLIVDETGVEKEFELVVSFDIEDKTYVLVSENEESDDVYAFFKADRLMPVEDEAELALIEAKYDEIMGIDDHDHDDEANVISLVDDTGVVKDFEIIASLDIQEKKYMLLAESEDVCPFFVTEDGEGLMPVEDEAEFALVLEAYEELIEKNKLKEV